MESTFSIDVKKSKVETSVLVSGELIINHIQKIKSKFLKSVDFSNNLCIKVTNPSSIDITFIQLVCALNRTCSEKGLEFSAEGTFSEEMYSLVSNAGFKDLFKL